MKLSVPDGVERSSVNTTCKAAALPHRPHGQQALLWVPTLGRSAWDLVWNGSEQGGWWEGTGDTREHMIRD